MLYSPLTFDTIRVCQLDMIAWAQRRIGDPFNWRRVVFLVLTGWMRSRNVIMRQHKAERGMGFGSSIKTSLPSASAARVHVSVCVCVCVQSGYCANAQWCTLVQCFAAQPVGRCTAVKSMQTGVQQLSGRVRGRCAATSWTRRASTGKEPFRTHAKVFVLLFCYQRYYRRVLSFLGLGVYLFLAGEVCTYFKS